MFKRKTIYCDDIQIFKYLFKMIFYQKKKNVSENIFDFKN